jgi:hypothetical protein
MFLYLVNEHVPAAVNLYTCIREVSGSNFDPNIGNPEIFRGSSQSLEAKARIVFILNHYLYFAHHFQFVIQESF